MGGSKKVEVTRLRISCRILIATGCVLVAQSSLAEQLVLELVPQSSSLSGLGFVPALAVNTTAQDPAGDSVTTTYSGTITVDVDNLTNPTSLTFVSANAVAAISGNWLPEPGGGSEGDPKVDGDADPGTPAPANYGFFLDAGAIGQLYAASRDTILSLNSSAISVSGGQFDPFGIAITIPQGVYHSNVNSPVFGDDAGVDEITDESGSNCTDMAGMVDRCGTAMGNYAVGGEQVTLTLPMDFILGEGDDIVVTFTGMLVATASLSAGLVGDYNDNGTVDAADYVVWRENQGTMNTLPNDDIGGTIGATHYAQWAAHFGDSAGSGNAFGVAAVPEPASVALILTSLLSLQFGARRRRQ